jgi:type IV pilus assembly protein PilF
VAKEDEVIMRRALAAIWLPVCWLVVMLAGCAGLAGVAHGCCRGHRRAAATCVTESDEPDGRRRAPLRLELASGYFEQGQTNVALDEIKQVMLIDPSFADAYNLRGLVYMRLNDIPMAEDSFRRALALNPRDADVAPQLRLAAVPAVALHRVAMRFVRPGDVQPDLRRRPRR